MFYVYVINASKFRTTKKRQRSKEIYCFSWREKEIDMAKMQPMLHKNVYHRYEYRLMLSISNLNVFFSKMEEVKRREMELLRQKKKIAETENKLKQQQVCVTGDR